jgi:hypothetical protein
LRPPKLTVDRGRIERFRLPHFQLIDSRAGKKVATNEPRLRIVPFIGLFGCPTFCRVGLTATNEECYSDERGRRY